MGIYIKNIQKPNSCVFCHFRPSGMNYCALLDRCYVDYETDCPIQEIRETHGRLIDCDALLKKLKDEYKEELEQCPPNSIEQLVSDMIQAIWANALSEKNAPTILGAETAKDE